MAAELAKLLTLRDPGTEDDQIRRGLPPFLEGLPDADPQLAELASLVDIDQWDQIA